MQTYIRHSFLRIQCPKKIGNFLVCNGSFCVSGQSQKRKWLISFQRQRKEELKCGHRSRVGFKTTSGLIYVGVQKILVFFCLFSCYQFVFMLPMWEGHFQPILLNGALDVIMTPTCNAWTLYSLLHDYRHMHVRSPPTYILFLFSLPHIFYKRQSL